MFKKVFQQGRSEREHETYLFPYVEDSSDARTQLEAFFNILLEREGSSRSSIMVERTGMISAATYPECRQEIRTTVALA